MLKADNRKYSIRSAKPLAAAGMLILWACSVEPLSPEGGSSTKSPIELSVGIAGNGADVATKTVVTTDNPYGHTADAFASTTSLYMVMKADENAASTPALPTKYTRTMGVTADKVGSNTYNAVNFTGNYIRYWEDAHSRNSALSIYAACVPGKQSAINIASSTTYDSNTWSETAITPIITWPLSGSVTTQDAAFIANQDLCFSNNVSNLSGDNRVKFNNDTPNKFDRNKRLYFNHALTKVTFKIVKGVGFDTAPFEFSISGKNIELVGFNSTGTFDLSTGEFTTVNSTSNIEQFADTKTAGDSENYVLTALMLPGTDLNGTDKDALDRINFTIDHNQYHLTKGQLKVALDGKTLSNSSPALAVSGDTHTMRPGVHYIFTLTVGKTKMEQLTAAVVDWETVEATVNPSNARVNVSLLDASGVAGSTIRNESPATFDLYKSDITHTAIADNDFQNYSWATGYTASGNKATLTWSTDHYSTQWLWPDNKTFYHFRAVAPVNHTVSTNTTPDPDVDYISLTGASSYTDVQWGAPFLALADGQKLTYSTTTGFDNTSGENHQIYKAIGATNDVIKLVMFHMMSDVKIVLQTTGGADAVTLTGATLSFTNIASTGTVKMGDGLVTPGTTTTLDGGTVDATNHDWHYGFVPQSLASVVLTITTNDNNQYKVNIGSVVGSAVSTTLLANPYTAVAGGHTIDAWYPNYKYTYTFTLKKTGVEKITCTLANWEDVTAGDDNVQIQ